MPYGRTRSSWSLCDPGIDNADKTLASCPLDDMQTKVAVPIRWDLVERHNRILRIVNALALQQFKQSESLIPTVQTSGTSSRASSRPGSASSTKIPSIKGVGPSKFGSERRLSGTSRPGTTVGSPGRRILHVVSLQAVSWGVHAKWFRRKCLLQGSRSYATSHAGTSQTCYKLQRKYGQV